MTDSPDLPDSPDQPDSPDFPADRDGQRHDPPGLRSDRRERGYRRPMVLVLVLIPVIIAALAVGGAIVIRRQPDNPADWHLDPLTAPSPATPNSYRVAPAGESIDRDADAPTFSVPVSELAAAFDTVALGDDRVDVLAGSAADGFVTYVQRSAFFAFPDYVSVRFIDADDGDSTLAVFSRSRYGKGDLGVNKKRVIRWLEQLDQAIS